MQLRMLVAAWVTLIGVVFVHVVQGSQDADSATDYNWYHDSGWKTVGTPHRLRSAFASKPFDDAVTGLASAGSRECGAAGKTWDAALACVYRARSEHASARVEFHNMGVDSLLGWGIVSDANGLVTLVRYDSSPCGGGDCPYALRSTTCKRVSEPPPASEAPQTICDDPRF